MLVFGFGLFVMAASCYLLFITSEPLEEVGGRLGKLLHLPEDVIASTFQALATSGPEIVMAILAATPFVANEVWRTLQMGEKACSGCLNMCFSAMDNLIGIGCVGMIFMIYKKTVDRDEVIVVEPSVMIGLGFYIISSLALSLFITISLHTNILPDGREILVSTITEVQAWGLMIIGICFIISQFFIPNLISNWQASRAEAAADPPDAEGDEDAEGEDPPLPTSFGGWLRDLVSHGFLYAFLVFGLIIFVRECLAATFNMAMVGIVSVGGILIMFTSYVSSFPEFMMTYRYAVANKKSALLGMLFGSNVIDLAFAGFRSIWLHEPMDVYTTGRFQQLFPIYIWCLPIFAVAALIALWTGKFKYKHAYPLVVFYIIYIVSGFILL